jgi:hypothetical protein
MKPFNLEKALAGDPVITRDGRKVTDIHYFKAKDLDTPVIAEIDNTNLKFYTNDGKYYHKFYYQNNDSHYDLFMAPVIKTYWVNIYKHSNGTILQSSVFNCKEDADMDSNEILSDSKYYTYCTFVKTLSFEMEE